MDVHGSVLNVGAVDQNRGLFKNSLEIASMLAYVHLGEVHARRVARAAGGAADWRLVALPQEPRRLGTHHHRRRRCHHDIVQLVLGAMDIGLTEIAEAVAAFDGLHQIAAALNGGSESKEEEREREQRVWLGIILRVYQLITN